MLRRSSPWFSLVTLAIAAGCSGQIANVAEPVDGGEATDSGRRTDAGIFFDGGIVDSSVSFDAGPRRDSGVFFDSGRDSSSFDGGGVCAPADVSAFQPPAYKPAHRQQGACTAAQISSYFQSCFAVGNTMQTCATFTSANQACASCITTPDTAASYGAVITRAGIVSIDIGGCIELEDPNGLACAKAYRASELCPVAACNASCPVTDDASFQLYLACSQQAAANGCSAFTMGAACANAEADGGAAAACLQGQSFEDLYNQVAPIFCGP